MDIKPDSEETTALLQQIRNGRPAFDQLFGRHRGTVRQLVDLRFDTNLRARIDPSDVVQETQLEAFRRLSDFLSRQPMPFHLWLRKMAHERLIMARRHHVHRECRAVGKELPLPDRSSVMLGNQLLAADKSPSQQMNEEELADQVREAFAQLADPDREILLMRTYEGLSYEEIACILEIESATARKRHGRALVRLHRLLVDNGISESQI